MKRRQGLSTGFIQEYGFAEVMPQMDSGFSYVKIIGQLRKFDRCRDSRAQKNVPAVKTRWKRMPWGFALLSP
jgi:hypothetical protein